VRQHDAWLDEEGRLEKPCRTHHPSGAAELASGPVRELRELIERDAVIRMLVEEMLAQAIALGYFSYGGSSLCLVFQPGAIDEFLLPSPPDPMVDPSAGPPVLVNAAIAVAR